MGKLTNVWMGGRIGGVGGGGGALNERLGTLYKLYMADMIWGTGFYIQAFFNFPVTVNG